MTTTIDQLLTEDEMRFVLKYIEDMDIDMFDGQSGQSQLSDYSCYNIVEIDANTSSSSSLGGGSIASNKTIETLMHIVEEDDDNYNNNNILHQAIATTIQEEKEETELVFREPVAVSRKRGRGRPRLDDEVRLERKKIRETKASATYRINQKIRCKTLELTQEAEEIRNGELKRQVEDIERQINDLYRSLVAVEGGVLTVEESQIRISNELMSAMTTTTSGGSCHMMANR